MNMNFNLDLQNLDIHNIGQWPIAVKVISILLACIALFIVGYKVDTSRQLDILLSERKKETQLKEELMRKHAKAANLEAYKEQMQTMKLAFGALLRQLPEKTEVPGLIEDISHQGLASGLMFRTIRLLPEKRIDFYLELPIEISVEGTYHELGEFVSNIAALPRIVTLHDFTIQPANKEDSGDKLIMNITAKTYRYTQETEDASDDAAKGTKDNV